MAKIGVLFERAADGVWLGSCPSVRGAFAQGKTLPACRRRLREAIESVLLYAPADDLDDLLQSQPVRVTAEVIDAAVPERPARDLITQAEIARIAGVSRQAVHNWTKAASDFPRPAARGTSGGVWEREDILRWLSGARRVAGRPSARESWPVSWSSKPMQALISLEKKEGWT